MRNSRGSVRLVALVAAMLFVFVGCKKSSSTTTSSSGTDQNTTANTSSAEAYATGVCGAINGWLDTIQSGATELQNGSISSAKEGKAAMVGYLDDVTTATDEMISTIKALGPPDVPNGEEIHATLQSALSKVKDVFAQARDQAAQLSTTDQAAFAAQAQAIGTSLQTASTEVDQSLSAVSSADLDSAFKASPECQQLSQTTASVSP